MPIRTIITAPNPVLSTPGKIVVDPKSAEVRSLISDMKETVIAADGVGLAAPQVGVSLRVIVINYQQPPYALINPETIWRSNSSTVLEEGCLSVPSAIVPIQRARNIVVSAMTEQGQVIEIRAKDLLSKIIQHEIDHISGILIIDKKYEQ